MLSRGKVNTLAGFEHGCPVCGGRPQRRRLGKRQRAALGRDLRRTVEQQEA